MHPRGHAHGQTLLHRDVDLVAVREVHRHEERLHAGCEPRGHLHVHLVESQRAGRQAAVDRLRPA